MSDSRKVSKPQWYESLQKQPHTRQTFKQEMMDNVIEQVRSGSKGTDGRYKRAWRAPMVITVAACILLLFFMVPRLLEPGPDGASATYNPQTVQVGDTVSGMQVAEIIKGSYGVGSIQTIFEGEVELTGTFEYRTIEDPYHANEVIFRADQESVSRLPLIDNTPAGSVALVLQTGDPALKGKFGTPGATGRATIVINRYSSVYAEILEGTPNTGSLRQVQWAEVQAPPEAHLSDAELSARLRPFPVSPDAADVDPGHLFGWLEQVHHNFNEVSYGLSLTKVSEAQVDLIRQWLLTVYTEGSASEWLTQFTVKQEDGYWITGASSNMMPLGGIDSVTPIQVKQVKDGHILYEANLSSGQQHSYLLCDLVKDNGKFKISTFSHKLY